MIDPKIPEDCLQFIRCRITEDECELTCKLIEVLIINARCEGKIEGIEQTTEAAIARVNRQFLENAPIKGRLQ